MKAPPDFVEAWIPESNPMDRRPAFDASAAEAVRRRRRSPAAWSGAMTADRDDAGRVGRTAVSFRRDDPISGA